MLTRAMKITRRRAAVLVVAVAIAGGALYGYGGGGARAARSSSHQHRLSAQAAPDLSKIGVTLSAAIDPTPPVTAAQAVAVADKQVGGKVIGTFLRHCQTAADAPGVNVDCWVVSEVPATTSAAFNAISPGVGATPPMGTPTISVVLVDAHSGSFILAASA